jgi:hypothetical protein
MVAFDELDTANFTGLSEHTAMWKSAAGLLKQVESGFAQVLGMTKSAGWGGQAADAADAELELLNRQLVLASLDAQAIANALDPVVPEFNNAQMLLRNVVSDADADGFSIAATGMVFNVVDKPGTTPAATGQAREALRQTYFDRVNGVIRQVNDSDSKFAGVLMTLTAGDIALTNAAAMQNVQDDIKRAAGLYGVGPVPPDMNPGQAAEWWTKLSTTQQGQYIDAFPTEVGRMDGLPAAARDRANRIGLDERLATLGPMMNGPVDDKTAKEWVHLNKIKRELTKNAEVRVQQPNVPPVLLLKFDEDVPRGGVVMSLGDPDKAKNTAVLVPGTGASAETIDGSMKRLMQLQSASQRYGTDPQAVATVVWLDYDPPPSDTDVQAMAAWDRSQEGAKRLTPFIDGLRTQAPGNHLTVLGHSYGSTTIGDAARTGGGLPVDDIMVAGSPGMHVDYANQLNLDDRHIWALASDNDNVPEIGRGAHTGSSHPGGLPFAIRDLVMGEELGNVPSDKDFEANVMTANPGGHSDYWDARPDGTPDVSLDNQARVIMGTYNDPDPNKRPQLIYGDMPTGSAR